VEQASRRLRRISLSLPADCVSLHLKSGVGGDCAARILAALGGRPVRRVEFIDAVDSLPPEFWSVIGGDLVVRAQR